MAGDVDNPRIYDGADLYTAPLGTTAPTDLTTPWAAAWKSPGLVSEDALTESREEDVTDHYAFGGLLVRTKRSKHKRTFTVTLLEDGIEAFGLANPGSTASTTGGVTTRTYKVPEADPRAFGMELTDGSITMRRVIPRGEITEIGEISYADNEMRKLVATITVYPAADGTLYIELTDDPQAVVPDEEP